MRININKNNIPFEIKVKSLGRVFILIFKHFISDDTIYLDLLDEENYYLIENERLFTGRPVGLYLLKDEKGNLNTELPQAYIVPMTETGEEITVTYENLGTKVFLEYYELTKEGALVE